MWISAVLYLHELWALGYFHTFLGYVHTEKSNVESEAEIQVNHFAEADFAVVLDMD